MAPNQAFSLLVVASLAMFLAVAGVASGIREAGPLSYANRSDREVFEAMRAGWLVPGPSIASKQMILRHCATAISGFQGRAQPTQKRRELIAVCDARAAAITAESPAHSFGWLVRAMIAADQGDTALFNHYLLLSSATGPSELWICALRIDLAEDNFAALNTDAFEALERDLVVAAQTESGVTALSARYFADATFREHVIGVLSELPEEAQRSFFYRIKAIAEGRKLPTPQDYGQ